MVEDLSPVICPIAKNFLDLPVGKVLFCLVNKRVELASIRYSLICDFDCYYLFRLDIDCQMDFYPASMDLPFLSHPLAAVGYFDPR